MAGFLGFLVGDGLVEEMLSYAEELGDYTRLNFLCDAFNMLPSDTQQDDDVIYKFISCFHMYGTGHTMYSTVTVDWPVQRPVCLRKSIAREG